MKKTVFLVGMVFALFSCNSGSKESSGTNSDVKSEKASSKSSSKTYDCLKKFEEDYSLLLTKEEMISVYPFDADAAKKELSSGTYGQHTYQWPSDRPTFTMEVSGMKMQLPDQNALVVKNLSFYSDDIDLESCKDIFDMGYKKLSDEELAQIEKNLDKAEDEVKKTGKDLMEVRAKSAWQAVEGLGSSAWYKWSDRWGGELVVLAGKAKFTIMTKISSDADENKGIAIKLAEKVLAKCK